MVIALNVAEDDLGNRDLLARFEPACQNQAIEAMLVSAKVEAEIALLDTSEENRSFWMHWVSGKPHWKRSPACA